MPVNIFHWSGFILRNQKKQTQKLKTVASEDGSAAIASQISHPVYVNKTSNEFSSSDVFLPLYENLVPKESLSHEGNMNVKTVPRFLWV